MGLLNTLNVLSLMIWAVGCGSAQNDTPAESAPLGVDAPSKPVSSDTPVTTPTTAPVIASPAPTGTPVNLQYFQITANIISVSGGVYDGQTVQGTGYCTRYQDKQYCWDDGIKTIDGKFGRPFFGIDEGHRICPNNTGPCESDLLLKPILVTPRIFAMMPATRKSDKVLNYGTPVDVVCTELDGKLDCVNFVIDLNQVPIL